MKWLLALPLICGDPGAADATVGAGRPYAGEFDHVPTPIVEVMPEYPIEQWLLGKWEIVSLDFWVGDEGKPNRIRLDEYSKDNPFAGSAQAALAQSRFKSWNKAGTPDSLQYFTTYYEFEPTDYTYLPTTRQLLAKPPVVLSKATAARSDRSPIMRAELMIMHVDDTGAVRSADFTGPRPQDEQEVRKAALRWRFEPHVEDGKKTPMWVVQWVERASRDAGPAR